MTEVFVFGSNLAGRHRNGTALHAKVHYDAQHGIGIGRTGEAYAIPTEDGELNVLRLEEIKSHVDVFKFYANEHPELTFNVSAIGTGLAGYAHHKIAPMFYDVPSNCNLPVIWQENYNEYQGAKNGSTENNV